MWGDWGKLYKRYTVSGSTEIRNSMPVSVANEEQSAYKAYEKDDEITYEKNCYREIGQDVQFKRVAETTSNQEQSIRGLIGETEYTVAETTDAYYDSVKRAYACVVKSGDIVNVFGRLWIVNGVRAAYKHTPAKQEFYYCDLKGIL